MLGRNIFAEAFQQFDEEEFFSKLHHKVKNKPYYDRYRGFKNTVNILSHIFSVASALTSSYAVYWLASWAGASLWLSLVIGAVILIFMERIKRKASEETWQVYFFEGKLPIGWLLLSLALFGMGVFSSAFGAKEGTKDFAPLAQRVQSDSTAESYQQRIAALEKENKALSRQKNAQGEIYWPAQRQMARNKEIIVQYETRALALDEKREGKNENLLAERDKNVAFASRVLMIVQIFMELCFEACIAYVWYFYFRSYVERKRMNRLPEDPLPAPAAFPPTARTYSPPPPANEQEAIPLVRNAVPHSPIGFFTEAQKETFRAQTNSSRYVPGGQGDIVSVHACTDLSSGEIEVGYDDLYTVLHEYQRGGKTCFTPYTENQVLSRIGQYERDIEEATHKNLGQDILANRQRWLVYWRARLEELYQKQREAGIR